MKTDFSGLYQLENGLWAYRYTIVVDGKKKDVKRTKSEDGKPFKTQSAAARARTAALKREGELAKERKKPRPITVAEVYQEYCEKGRTGKAYTTILKQESLWKNHLCERFGARLIDEISVGEINDYLAHLYFVEGYAYRYVESFLKMFYLIFGQAYSRDYIPTAKYHKLCTNRETKISMPPLRVDDDTDIVAFSPEEAAKLDEYFHGTNAETAYMLGRWCGLRINECYGLKWENIDIERGTITVEQQMQYQEGLIKLVPPKTRNARRTLYMSERLREYFTRLKEETARHEATMSAQRAQNQTILPDTDGTPISSLLLVNSLPNGKIQTVNSMKYHTRMIKETLGIEFKYHYLRHTYGTRLAEMNTPTHILCNQMVHASGKVTERYYLAVSKPGIDVLTQNLNRMS